MKILWTILWTILRILFWTAFLPFIAFVMVFFLIVTVLISIPCILADDKESFIKLWKDLFKGELG